MEPLTYQKIEDTLRMLINDERRLVREFAQAGETLVTAEVVFKKKFAEQRAYARSSYRSEGTRTNEGMIEDDAQMASHEEFAAYLKAKTLRETLKTRLASVHMQIEAMRSLMSSHRAMNDA